MQDIILSLHTKEKVTTKLLALLEILAKTQHGKSSSLELTWLTILSLKQENDVTFWRIKMANMVPEISVDLKDLFTILARCNTTPKMTMQFKITLANYVTLRRYLAEGSTEGIAANSQELSIQPFHIQLMEYDESGTEKLANVRIEVQTEVLARLCAQEDPHVVLLLFVALWENAKIIPHYDGWRKKE